MLNTSNIAGPWRILCGQIFLVISLQTVTYAYIQQHSTINVSITSFPVACEKKHMMKVYLYRCIPVGSGNPVRVLRLFHNKYTGYN